MANTWPLTGRFDRGFLRISVKMSLSLLESAYVFTLVESVMRHSTSKAVLLIAGVCAVICVHTIGKDLVADEPNTKAFFSKHCVKCHGAKKAESGLRLDNLPVDFVAGSRQSRAWQEVMDRLNLGEMPPEGEARPKQAEVDAINAWIRKRLRRAIADSKDGAGRVVLRRMNRDEYNYTIQDLLGVNARPAALASPSLCRGLRSWRNQAVLPSRNNRHSGWCSSICLTVWRWTTSHPRSRARTSNCRES